MIREIKKEEINQLLELYTQMNNDMPTIDHKLLSLWNNIVLNENYHIIVAVEDEKVVSS